MDFFGRFGHSNLVSQKKNIYIYISLYSQYIVYNVIHISKLNIRVIILILGYISFLRF